MLSRWFAVVVVALAGCSTSRMQSPIRPDADVTVFLVLRPILTQPPETVRWTSDEWDACVAEAARRWKPHGVEISSEPWTADGTELWNWTRYSGDDQLASDLTEKYRGPAILPVFLVQYIDTGIPLLPAAGFARWPHIGYPFIGIVSRAPACTLAHEIGHTFGLAHTWDNGMGCLPSDCGESECGLNLMGYCDDPVPDHLLPFTLTQRQRHEATNGALRLAFWRD